MMRQVKTSSWVGLATCAMLLGRAMPALCADNDGKPGSPPDSSAYLTTVQKIMDNAVRNLTTRYNLNEAQAAYTKQLMDREVFGFIQDHDDIMPLIRDLIDLQRDPSKLNAKEGDDQTRRIGTNGLAVWGAVAKTILRANQEWRQCLTEEQRRLHTFDLDQMDGTFGEITRNLNTLKEGKGLSNGVFPAAKQQRLEGEPMTPARPKPGFPNPVEDKVSPDRFEQIVKAFIAKHQLDVGQKEAAFSLMKEYQENATKVLDDKRRKIVKVKAAYDEGIIKGDKDVIQDRKKALEELYAPLTNLFGEFEKRLHNLLTQEQIQRAAEKAAPAPAEGQPKPEAPVQTTDTPAPPADGNKEAPKKVSPVVSSRKP